MAIIWILCVLQPSINLLTILLHESTLTIALLLLYTEYGYMDMIVISMDCDYESHATAPHPAYPYALLYIQSTIKDMYICTNQ